MIVVAAAQPMIAKVDRSSFWNVFPTVLISGVPELGEAPAVYAD
jgi:hypothetical protein